MEGVVGFDRRLAHGRKRGGICADGTSLIGEDLGIGRDLLEIVDVKPLGAVLQRLVREAVAKAPSVDCLLRVAGVDDLGQRTALRVAWLGAVEVSRMVSGLCRRLTCGSLLERQLERERAALDRSLSIDIGHLAHQQPCPVDCDVVTLCPEPPQVAATTDQWL